MTTDLTTTITHMTKAEAEALHQEIVTGAKTFAEETSFKLLRMDRERGWEALGHKSFREYAEAVRGEVGLSSMYNWRDWAEVNDNLSRATEKTVRLPLTHALVLKDLEPDQQLLAFNEATKGDEEAKPTEKVFERAAKKVAPAAKPKKRKAATRDDIDGWSKEDLKKDPDLAMALVSIAGVWGSKDVDAIRNGTIGLGRADILVLTKLNRVKLLEIQDLVMGNRWTPAQALKFAGSMPDENTTLEEMQNYCLSTKGKFYEATINGFTHTVKANRAALRR